MSRKSLPAKTTPQRYGGKRPGGRSADVLARLNQAAAIELAQFGYVDFSIGRVAAAAGVSRTTVYRRWPRKELLVADLMVDLNAGWVPEPEGATIREQMLSIVRDVHATITDPAVQNVIRSLAAMGPEDGAVVRDSLRRSRAALYDRLVAEALERGELTSEVDGWRLAEAVIAPVWMRIFVTGITVDEAFLAEVVDHALRGFGATSVPH